MYVDKEVSFNFTKLPELLGIFKQEYAKGNLGMNKYHFIIVGQGLAGSLLAYRLLKAGKNVLVIDKDEANTSSKVAAGIYNPITGKRLLKSWMADELFNGLEDFYQSLEKELDQSFLHATGIYRPFLNIEEQNDWMSKSADPALKPIVKKVDTQSTDPKYLKDDFGGINVLKSGFVEVEKLVAAFKVFFERHHVYLKASLNPKDIQFDQHGVIWSDYRAEKLIFCGGVSEMNNPFWSWLPFNPVKGEILLGKLSFVAKQVLNRGVFILPACDGIAKIGSTYQWKDLNNEITLQAKEELLAKTDALIKVKPEIVGQVAGVRPAIVDRRPILGLHPEYKHIAIFNGLGTKGVSLAPYFSKMMADFLIDGQSILEEVKAERFFSVYFKA